MTANVADLPILVVDDEPDLRDALCVSLSLAGYETVAAANGREALTCLRRRLVALVISDIAMPQMNGYQLLEAAREEPVWRHIPFIFLTARGLDSDIRFGKTLGVDDYLVKPVMPEDLLATVRGKLVRAGQLVGLPAAAPDGRYTIGALTVDKPQHRVWWQGQTVPLSAREFALLAVLAEHAGEVVRAEDLLWTTHQLKGDLKEAGGLIRPLIRSIRRKMGFAAGNIGCLENVRGVGYRLRSTG